MVLMVISHFRRRLVVRSPPSLDLVLPKSLHHLLLIQPDEITVTPLVQPPVFINWNVFLPHFHQDEVDGADAAAQKRGVRFVEEHA